VTQPRRHASIAVGLLVTAGVVAVSALAASCSPPPQHTPTSRPITAPTTTPRDPVAQPQREQPPPSGPAPDLRLPAALWSELPNGIKLATVQNRVLPVLQIRVAVLTGRAADGERPGLASLTAELVKESGAGGLSSRDTLARIESLGATLSLETEQDYTSIGLAVTRDHLAEALDLLGAITLKSPLNQAQFDRLKKRGVESASALAKEDGDWSARVVLYRDLFALPTERHPYASFDATADEISKITAADCRTFYSRYYVPKNTIVVVTGDTTPEAVRGAAEKALGAYRGAAPPALSFTDPVPQEARKITVIDRPKSSQSNIYVGMLGPRPTDPTYAAFDVARSVLGKAFTGRLFLDLREKRGLAYITFAPLTELAESPSVFYAYAATQTPKTGLAAEALLQHIERLGTTAPEAQEVDTAANNLAGMLAIDLDVPGAIADTVVWLRGLGLPDDFLAGYLKEVRKVTPETSGKAASEHLRAGHEVIVAAGDAQVIGPMLSRFGEVKVVDATNDFRRIRTIARNTSAALEAPQPTSEVTKPSSTQSAPSNAKSSSKTKPAPKPLDGATLDYAYDARDIGHPERAWLGRAFVHTSAAAAGPAAPLPIVVFIHGLNTDRIKYRWNGGGNEGDVRRIIADLIESGRIPPTLIAAPSSIIPAAIANAVTSWPAFDLDRFLDLTAERLAGVATIDRSRVIVAGHSGAGCNPKGGLPAAIHGKTRPLAALSIDTCMLPSVAVELARAHPSTHIVVSWQTQTWAKRPIAGFKSAFLKEITITPPNPGVLRELEHVTPTEPMPHDAMVPLTLKTWLPRLLAPSPRPTPSK
jgi:predicted Zn-dependent peptidase